MQALGIAALGTKVIGQVAEGESYHEQGKYNRAVANRNALDSQRDAAAQIDIARTQARKAIGDQLVAQGGSGFEMGTGTAVDALAESQVNSMLDAMTIRRQGDTRAAAYRSQGQLAYMEGQSKATASYFGAAKSLADSAANYAAQGG